MKEIKIYDAEARRIKQICWNLRITPADLIESVIDLIEDASELTDYKEWGMTEGDDDNVCNMCES